jgi:hypothetical protein
MQSLIMQKVLFLSISEAIRGAAADPRTRLSASLQFYEGWAAEVLT